MNAPSPWLRPLQLLATALAFAIAVLTVLLLQREPTPPLPAIGEVRAASNGADAARAAVDPAATNPSAATGDASSAPESAPAATAVLFGCVRYADGTLVEKGMLSLLRDGERVAYTALQGKAFAFAGLAPGTYQLTSRIDDQLPLQRDVLVTAPRTRLDLQLDAAWQLTVDAVTADGQPLREAAKLSPMFRALTANAFAAPLAGDLPPSSLSSVDAGLGTFRGNDFVRGGPALPKQTVGVLTLPADQPLHVALLLRNVVLAQQPVPAGQEKVTFTLPATAVTDKMATVRLRCVDAAGQPIAGARTSLTDRQTGGGGKQTDDDGRVTLEGLASGRLGLGIWHKELAAPSVEIDVPPGADLDLGDVVLLPKVDVPLSLEGLGKEARVRWVLLDPLPHAGWHARDGYFSADNGTTATYPVYPGRYQFLVRNGDDAAITEVDLRTAPAQPLQFRLARGAPLRIQNRVGPGYARLEIRTASGGVLYDRELTGTWTLVHRLPPGSYRVAITDIANHTTERVLQVPAEGAELTVP